MMFKSGWHLVGQMVPLLGSVAWEQISSIRGFFRSNV